MSLAIATGIPAAVWLREDETTIATAIDLLSDEED